MAIISKLVALLGVDPKDFDKKLKGAEKTLAKTARKLTSIGKDLTTSVSLPIVAIGTLAVKAFADFDSAMTKSTAIMGDVNNQLAELEEAALNVARTTTFSAAEAGEAFFFLASAGLDATESIAALPRVASFAQAGMFDLALATDLLTDAQSALGLTTGDITQDMMNLVRVSDVLVKANTIANASVQQFSEALTTQAAAAARNVGIEIEEVTSVLAAFADQGIKGSEAGTKFAIVVRDLTTKAALNAEQFKRLGISVFDSRGELLPLADILQNLEQRFSSASDEVKKLTLLQLGFSDRSVGALQSLIGLSGRIREYEKDLKSAGGITEQVAQKQLQSFTNQMKLLKNQVTEVLISLGKELVPVIMRDVVPVIKSIIKFVASLVESFGKLSTGTKTMIAGMVAFAAVLGPAAIAVGVLTKVLIALKFVLLSPAFALITVGGALILGIISLGKELVISADGAAAFAGEMVGASEAMKRAAKAGRTLEEQLRLENIQQAQKNILAIRSQMIALDKTVADFAAKKDFGKGFQAAVEVSKKLKQALIDAGVELRILREEAAKPGDFNFVGPVLSDAQEGFQKLTAFFKKAKAEGIDTFNAVKEVGKAAFTAVGQTVDSVITTTSEKFAQFFLDIEEKQMAFAESANQAWSSWLATATDVTSNIKLATLDFFESFAAGLGDAVAQIVVFGAEAKDVFKSLLKNILAQIISTLVKITVEFLIASIARSVIGTAAHVLAVGQAIQLVYLATLASISAIPIIGPAIAPAAAAAAAAAAGPASAAAGAGGSAFGIASIDTGGLVMADGLARIHQGERVLKPNEVKMLPDLESKGAMSVIVELDGQIIAQKILPRVGRELRMRGVGK